MLPATNIYHEQVKIFRINFGHWQHCMYEGPSWFGELLTKVVFSGKTGIDGKIAKSSKWFRKFGKLCPFRYVSTKWTTVSFGLLPYFEAKLNKAKCVHSLPQKRGLRQKPVPGRGCPSLKLKLSRWAQRRVKCWGKRGLSFFSIFAPNGVGCSALIYLAMSVFFFSF